MSGAATSEPLSTDLVDPAVEASLLPRSSSGRSSRSSDRHTVVDVKFVSVLLSRADKSSSWGFLLCGRSVPLRVGEITSDVASRLQKGDEIVEINGVEPMDYAEAIQVFQCARLHLQLRLRRTVCVNREGTPFEDTPTREFHGVGDNQSEDLACAMSTTGPTSSSFCTILEPDNGFSETVVQPRPASCDEPPCARPGVDVRHSTQRTPSQLLHNSQNADDGRCGVGLVGSSVTVSSGKVSSQPFSVDVENAWRQILFGRQTSQMVGHGCRNYRDLCDVLPIPMQRAVYDRRSCPFSAADGFTEEFHTAVQYTLTQRALSSSRGAISCGGTPVPHEHDDRPRDTASLNEDILGIETSRNEEIQRFRQAEGWTERCEALVAQHKDMLRIVECHTAEREGWCRGEVERYSQIEDVANEFLKKYRETVSRDLRAEGRNRNPHFAATRGRSRNEEGTTSSRSFRLPTPPPPPPPGQSGNHFSSVRRPQD
ncbi:putative formin [Trypanosoma theileri]|uniref:Putative formin n=1 Tax=Trypanosoma theileri TaxID=67003 RepID=A0A1X0P7X0_9TRYP|nr:putative formin [Trypanosoma theileri]ORC92945.1 putative formin [Trypanosoma theileri]